MKKQKRENGDGGGLYYAMFFIGIFFALIVFFYVSWYGNSFVLKEELAVGLHIVENYCLTTNNQSLGNGSAHGNELKRYHIITAGYEQDRASATTQVNAVGAIFALKFKEQFKVDENGVPHKKMAGASFAGGDIWETENTSSGKVQKKVGNVTVLRIETVKIYEPVYSMTYTPVYTGGTLSDFSIGRSISYWDVYTLSFNAKGEYLGFTRARTNSAPTLMGTGTSCEGATIESTISMPMEGINRYFTELANAKKKPDGNVTVNRETHQENYAISVTQAVDIVPESTDSRKVP